MSYVNNAHTTVLKPEGVKNAAPATAAEAKAKIAALFTVKNPENVIFTKDEIQAMNIAVRSLVKPGDHVITTVFEQAAVLRDRIRAIQLEQMAKNLTAETEEQADE